MAFFSWKPRFRPSLLATTLAVVVALALAGSFVALRWWVHPWAPGIVRALPPGDTLAYLNLDPLREAGLLGPEAQNQPVSPLPSPAFRQSPAYADFVHASGFDFERDLDALACSLQGPPLAPDQTTCILDGSFSPQFAAYLATHALHRQPWHGHAGYGFPGWARPERTLWIVPLDRQHVLATNAPNPAPIVQEATQWWRPSPRLWQTPLLGSAAIGYLAINVLQLSAAQQLDGAHAPWLGTSLVRLRLVNDLGSSVSLYGRLEAVNPGAAARTLAWAQAQIALLVPQLPAGQPGQISLRQALSDLQLHQRGSQIRLRLRLDPPGSS